MRIDERVSNFWPAGGLDGPEMTSSRLGGHDDDGSDGSSSAEFFPCDEYPQDVPGAIAEPVVGCATEVDQFVVGEARTARAELDRMRAALLRVSTVAVDLAERSLLLAESQSLPPRSRGMEQGARLQLYRRAFGHVDVQRAAESRQAAHVQRRTSLAPRGPTSPTAVPSVPSGPVPVGPGTFRQLLPLTQSGESRHSWTRGRRHVMPPSNASRRPLRCSHSRHAAPDRRAPVFQSTTPPPCA